MTHTIERQVERGEIKRQQPQLHKAITVQAEGRRAIFVGDNPGIAGKANVEERGPDASNTGAGAGRRRRNSTT
jgi:hypothetical protein